MNLTQDEINSATRSQFNLWLDEHGWPDWPLGTNGRGKISATLARELCEEAFHSGWHFGRETERVTQSEGEPDPEDIEEAARVSLDYHMAALLGNP